MLAMSVSSGFVTTRGAGGSASMQAASDEALTMSSSGNKIQVPPHIPLVPPRCDLCGGVMKLRRREPQLGPHRSCCPFGASNAVTLLPSRRRSNIRRSVT
jgi:hypothetical protein